MVRHHYRMASAISLALALAAAAPAAARYLPDPPAPSAPAGTTLCSQPCSTDGYAATPRSADPLSERGATLPHDPRSRAEVAALAARQSASGATSAPATVVRTVSPSKGFDWGDAAVGAGAAVVLMLLALGGALGVSSARRHAAQSAA